MDWGAHLVDDCMSVTWNFVECGNQDPHHRFRAQAFSKLADEIPRVPYNSFREICGGPGQLYRLSTPKSGPGVPPRPGHPLEPELWRHYHSSNRDGKLRIFSHIANNTSWFQRRFLPAEHESDDLFALWLRFMLFEWIFPKWRWKIDFMSITNSKLYMWWCLSICYRDRRVQIWTNYVDMRDLCWVYLIRFVQKYF